MIESKEKRQSITDDIKKWCDYVKVTPLLSGDDIPALVDTILKEFYNVVLCCGHMVRSVDDAIPIAFPAYEGRIDEITEGLYCQDCVERYKKELGAWEIKPLENA